MSDVIFYRGVVKEKGTQVVNPFTLRNTVHFQGHQDPGFSGVFFSGIDTTQEKVKEGTEKYARKLGETYTDVEPVVLLLRVTPGTYPLFAGRIEGNETTRRGRRTYPVASFGALESCKDINITVDGDSFTPIELAAMDLRIGTMQGDGTFIYTKFIPPPESVEGDMTVSAPRKEM